MDQICEIGEYLARLVEGPFKTAGAFLASLVVLYWDAAPQALRGAVVAAGVLFVCDIILGMTRALAERRFSSLGFGRAITKFVAYAVSLVAAWAVDYGLGVEAFAQLAMATLIAVREGISAMENSAALGVPWPASIRERLESLQEEAERTQAPMEAPTPAPTEAPTDAPPTGMETTPGDEDR